VEKDRISSSSGARFRVGVDVGGTFTDIVAVEEGSGTILVAKVHTVPADPSQGCIAGIDRLLAEHGLDPGQVSFVVHGTTIATNTIIEGKGAKAGLVTSAGFRDVLEIAYQTRPNLYDIFYDKVRPLIPRYLSVGVPERIAADGAVRVPLDEAALREAARFLAGEGVEAIAVAFLHAYRDPAHERLAGRILRDACPDIPVVLSSDVCPEFREYPRTSTAVVNAVLLPRITPYVARLEDRLRERGIGPGLHLMTSAGGIMAADTAKRLPVHLVESGPAAGVIGAAFVAGLSGFRNLLALDIGGTTAKAALVNDGLPQIAEQFEVGAAAIANVTSPKGQGYPVLTPVISLVEIGAGGGSIAQVDPGGALSVGPQSAGAVPGPACYGQGGEDPTLTDANVVLGRIDPDYFLGGAVRLDRERAERAIHDKVAIPAGLGLIEAAQAILDIANAKMTSALYFISVEQGIDPRDYVLVPSGGAGPLQAVAIGRALGVPTVLIPPIPGLNSAVGLLASDLKHDLVRTYMKAEAAADPAELSAIYAEMEAGVRALLRDEGVAAADMVISREVEMCYVGQSFQLKLPVPEAIDRATLAGLTAAFHARHAEAYGFANHGEPTRLVNLRLNGTGRVERPVVRRLPQGEGGAERAIKGRRQVHFDFRAPPLDTAIYDRARLCAGDRFAGPAIVEQMDTTLVLPPGAVAAVEAVGSIIVSTGAGGAPPDAPDQPGRTL
jgi:N-methylhydantoinase A